MLSATCLEENPNAEAAGNYSFTWKFEKDIMIADGMDCAWLDEVKLTPADEEPPAYLLGDVDNNGVVDAADALLTLRCAMDLISLPIPRLPRRTSTAAER